MSTLSMMPKRMMNWERWQIIVISLQFPPLRLANLARLQMDARLFYGFPKKERGRPLAGFPLANP